jgi:hypothetical protein
MAWYEKNVLFKDLMSNVDESADESDSSDEDPTTLDELDEDEVEHDLLKFPHDDKIPFSRLLSNSMVWQDQEFDNGDANPNMPLLDDNVQVYDASPPSCTCSNRPNSRHVHAINEFHGSGPQLMQTYH